MDIKEPRHRKPKLTDAERHERFLDVAKKVGASDRPEDFDRAFEQVVKPALKSDNDSKK